MINYNEEYWNDVKQVINNIPLKEKLYGKTVLITGATGMICSSIVDILVYLNRYEQAKIKIILAGRNAKRTSDRFYYTKNDEYTFVQYDATDDKDININSDYIIYGASNANPKMYTAEPVETMLANLIGLNRMLEMSAKNKVIRLLYISSSEVYGNIDEVRPRKETDYGYVDILNMRASYPCAKRAAETLCVAYTNEYELNTVIARPGHIYGPSITSSDTRATAEFTRNVANNEDIVMKSKGNQLRSYCYTLDCASAILTILLGGKNGDAYNISNRDSVCTISDIARELAKVSSKKVIYQMATSEESKGFNLMTDSSLDGEKLEGLGWKAEFNLEQGTYRTIKYYMQ